MQICTHRPVYTDLYMQTCDLSCHAFADDGSSCICCSTSTQVQLVTIDSTCLHVLGHNHASPTVFTSFELLHLPCGKLHFQHVEERCPAGASDDWRHIRATIESVSSEVLDMFRSTDQAAQMEPISYQAADMWAVGLLLVLMLTGCTPFSTPHVTSLSLDDEAERTAFVANCHTQWVCVWTAVHCALGCNVFCMTRDHSVFHTVTVCQSQFLCCFGSLVPNSTARLAAPCHVMVLVASAEGSCRLTAWCRSKACCSKCNMLLSCRLMHMPLAVLSPLNLNVWPSLFLMSTSTPLQQGSFGACCILI